MSDEFGHGFDTETESRQETENNYTYHYSYRGNENSEPKWEPDSGKYNSPGSEPPKPPKKKRSLWWIPVVAVTAAIVIGIIIAAVFGMRYLRREVSNSQFPTRVIEESSVSQEPSKATAEPEPSGSTTEPEVPTAEVGKDIPAGGIYLTDVSDIVDQVMPAVVSITSRTLVNSNNYGGFYYYYYGGGGSGSSQEVESGIGSGTIVGQNDKELLILTSYHVVEGSSSFYITFCDDESIDGYLKAASEGDDIAIVAVSLDDIPDETLEAIRIASLSDETPSIGDGAIVIGNALGYGQSVVTGVISAIDRQITIENNKTVIVLQTDAAINNGNSGGCLLNSRGEIVGISEAKKISSAVEGMCYAISVHYYYDTIMEMLEQPAAENREETEGSESSSSQGAYLGIYGYDIGKQLADAYEIPEGVYVINTISGGGAEAGGIEEGDVIIAMDGKEITSMSVLQNALRDYNAGDTVTITVMRSINSGYEEMNFDVTLTARIE